VVSGKGIRWDDRALLNKLQIAPARASRALVAIMAYHAPRAQGKMRSNAPWTDRTGNARNGLFSQPFADHPRYGIILAHRVNYGIWLEVRFSGRYAVINPTVQSEGPEVMRTCETLFSRIFGS
jgi:hypothetical protein